VAPDGNVFASINRGNRGGNLPPEFNNIGLWKKAEPGYPLANVRLGDMDGTFVEGQNMVNYFADANDTGDGRADYIALSNNGDVRIWRNGWIDDKPAYFQALGLRFPGQGMGDLRGVRFEDINVSFLGT
jgi:hypothetical protein